MGLSLPKIKLPKIELPKIELPKIKDPVKQLKEAVNTGVKVAAPVISNATESVAKGYTESVKFADKGFTSAVNTVEKVADKITPEPLKETVQATIGIVALPGNMVIGGAKATGSFVGDVVAGKSLGESLKNASKEFTDQTKNTIKTKELSIDIQINKAKMPEPITLYSQPIENDYSQKSLTFITNEQSIANTISSKKNDISKRGMLEACIQQIITYARAIRTITQNNAIETKDIEKFNNTYGRYYIRKNSDIYINISAMMEEYSSVQLTIKCPDYIGDISSNSELMQYTKDIADLCYIKMVCDIMWHKCHDPSKINNMNINQYYDNYFSNALFNCVSSVILQGYQGVKYNFGIDITDTTRTTTKIQLITSKYKNAIIEADVCVNNVVNNSAKITKYSDYEIVDIDVLYCYQGEKIESYSSGAARTYDVFAKGGNKLIGTVGNAMGLGETNNSGALAELMNIKQDNYVNFTKHKTFASMPNFDKLNNKTSPHIVENKKSIYTDINILKTIGNSMFANENKMHFTDGDVRIKEFEAGMDKLTTDIITQLTGGKMACFTTKSKDCFNYILNYNLINISQKIIEHCCTLIQDNPDLNNPYSKYNITNSYSKMIARYSQGISAITNKKNIFKNDLLAQVLFVLSDILTLDKILKPLIQNYDGDIKFDTHNPLLSILHALTGYDIKNKTPRLNSFYGKKNASTFSNAFYLLDITQIINTLSAVVKDYYKIVYGQFKRNPLLFMNKDIVRLIAIDLQNNSISSINKQNTAAKKVFNPISSYLMQNASDNEIYNLTGTQDILLYPTQNLAQST